MPDAVQALDVALDGPPEEPRVHGLVLSDRHVRQVRDGVELVVLLHWMRTFNSFFPGFHGKIRGLRIFQTLSGGILTSYNKRN